MPALTLPCCVILGISCTFLCLVPGSMRTGDRRYKKPPLGSSSSSVPQACTGRAYPRHLRTALTPCQEVRDLRRELGTIREIRPRRNSPHAL